MTWEGLNTFTLVLASFTLGASVASYLHARLGRQVDRRTSLFLILISLSGVLNATIQGSRVVAVISLALLVAAGPVWWKSVKALSEPSTKTG